MRKHILIVSPIPSHPQDAGNRARIYSMVTNLKKYGHEVYFLYIREDESVDESKMRNYWQDRFFSLTYSNPGAKKRTIIQRALRKAEKIYRGYPNFPFAVDDRYDEAVSHLAKALNKQFKFDVVIVEYVFFSKVLNCFKENTLKIIDTHDAFSGRYETFKQLKIPYSWYSTTEAQEAKGLHRADLVLAIQEKEEIYFRELIGEKVVTIGHTVAINKPKKLNFIRRKILYVGSSNENNVYGINYFINEVFSRIKVKFPETQLLLAGKICEAVEEVEGCKKLGYVENIDSLYEMSDLVINPILFGTGLKIKSIEALGYSKTLVTTSEGAKGLETGINTAFLVAEDAEKFENSIVRVFCDTNFANQLSENAYLFASKYNQSVTEPLEKLLSYSN